MTEKIIETQEISWGDFWSGVSAEEYLSRLTLHDRRLAGVLLSYLREGGGSKDRRVLELGCVYSKNLFFLPGRTGPEIRYFGLDTCIDPALRTGRTNPHRNVNIVVGDMFDCPFKAETMEMIISFGLIEHFPRPDKFLEACFHLLCPGGRLVVGYPSYTGLTGMIQRRVNPSALEYHFSLPAAGMAAELGSSGFTAVEAGYFGMFNPNMIDWGRGRLRKLLMYSAFAAIRPLEWLSRLTGKQFRSEGFSSYVLAGGIKPAGR